MTASMVTANLSTSAQLWVRDVVDRHRAEGRPLLPERVSELVEVAALRDQRDLAQRDAAAHQRDAAESPRAARFAQDAAQRAADLDKQLRKAFRAFERR